MVVDCDNYSDKPPKSPSMKAPADPVFERAVSRQPLAVSFFRDWLSAQNQIAQVKDLLWVGVLCVLYKGQAILSQWGMILKSFFSRVLGWLQALYFNFLLYPIWLLLPFFYRYDPKCIPKHPAC